LPSQKQLKWSQLRVGLTVIFASLTLGILIFLLSGAGGFFTKHLTIKAYFDNASGLRNGAPVRLNGVDIGNVKNILITPDKAKLATPVEVTMHISDKFSFGLRHDSVVIIKTAGVLGESYVDIESFQAQGPALQNGDVLTTRGNPDFNDVVRSSQGTLENLDALIKRLDHILIFVESGKGSIGKLVYDSTLYDRFAATVSEFKGIVDEVSQGHGSLGMLISNDDAYNKVIATLDKLNAIADDLQKGQGSAGKFLKDPALYNNANDTIANLKKVSEDINAGRGTLGRLTKDEELAKKIDKTISNLSALTSSLEAGQGSAGKLFKDESLYNNANEMLVETRALVKAIRENPKTYLSIKLHVF
jgi:phospholipid/cholesterol/gamma-HCH transport system substrate-binding protein